jgi:RNA polymerase sigma-70 factor (ECF subfamily)
MTRMGPIMTQGPSDRGVSGLAATFESHRQALLRFLAARCGDPAEAQDLLQDLWIRISTQSTGPIANPRAYLFRSANNLALNHSRARRRAMVRDRSWLSADDQAEIALEDRPDPALPADEIIARQQEAELLHRVISALPPGAQRALRLHRLEGHEQKDVAQIMGISRSGVEKHLAVAMKQLRDALAECGWFAPAVSEKEQTNTTESHERKNDHDGA